MFGASAQGLKLVGTVDLLVSVGAGVVVDELAGQDAVDQDGEFAGGSGDGGGLAGAGGEAAVKGAEGG